MAWTIRQIGAILPAGRYKDGSALVVFLASIRCFAPRLAALMHQAVPFPGIAGPLRAAPQAARKQTAMCHWNHHFSDPRLRKQCPICVNVTPLRPVGIDACAADGREGFNADSSHFLNCDNWGWGARRSAIDR